MKQSTNSADSLRIAHSCQDPEAARRERRVRSWVSVVANIFMSGLLCFGAFSSDAASQTLPTLTSAHQAHSLSAVEAAKGYPIHLRGIVTFYDAHLDPRQTLLFVHDSTGSMFVSVPSTSAQVMPAGTLVDLHGVSGMGDFAPIISQPRLSIISRSHPLPEKPARVSLTHLLTGEEDGQWVEVEGVIHSAFLTEHNVSLELSMRDGIIPMTLPREADGDYSRLVDAKVRIRANAGPMFNGDRQMVGARLLIPNLSAVSILEPGPIDAFDLPIREIETLSRFSSVTVLPRRIHIRGRVTFSSPGSMLCVRDANHGLCAQSTQTTPLLLGQMVDVAGFAEISDSVPSLSNAIYQPMPENGRSGLEPVTAVPLTVAQALHGKYGSELVQLDGQLVSQGLASPDAASDRTLLMASGADIYAVIVPHSVANSISRSWKNGSVLSVTGICSVQIDAERSNREGGAVVRKSFRILIRSSKDVIVLQQPSWWTPAHTVLVLALGLTATLLVLGWVIVLSRRLKRQAELLGESEERFRHMAQHDSLTGLPTRLLLRDRLDHAIEKAKLSNTGLAMLMLDLDKFKQINDTLGHQAGDEALKVSARRLGDIMRKNDTVARISGDEFIVLITDLHEEKEAETVAAKLVETLSVPFRIGNEEVPLSASVGVCTAFGVDLNAEALLKRVDAALYRAKARGRNCFELYTAEMARAVEANLQVRTALERALDEDEMAVYYQPMVNFKTGELTGFEALVRWHSKTMGIVMPCDFIPLAEETGMIIRLGEWVLREACRQIGELEQQMSRSFILAVNLSPRQIEQQKDLPQRVALALSDAKRPPHRLELEITESILMKDSATTRATLLQLQTSGVRLAIDDFGIGFSSLSYITRFAIDQIKIDRSFIQKCTHEGGSLAVVRAMIAMAHGLSINVVAEGVETQSEFCFLRDEGCDTAQGYYFSRPVPAEELPRIVLRLQQLLEVNEERLASAPYRLLAMNT